MKFVTCAVVSILFNITLYAQTDIRQLLEKLNTTGVDSNRAAVYDEIYAYYKYSKPDSAVYYLMQGLNDLTAAKFNMGIARMNALLANEDLEQGRVELAKRRCNEALRIYTEIGYKTGIAYVHNTLGTIEGKSANYDEATRHFMTALKIFEGEGNEAGVQATYLKLGVVNERINNLDRALDYYSKSMQLARQDPDSSKAVLLYNNIGIVYGKRGKYKEAMDYFDMALQHTNSPKLASIRILSLLNKGIVYDQTEHSDKALEYYNQALDMAKEKNFPEDYARISLNIVSLLEKKDPVKSMALLRAALDTTRRIGQRSLQAEILYGMVSVLNGQGHYKEALDLMEQYTNLKDSIFNIEKAKEIANLQAVYELDKSNARLQQLTVSEKRSTLQKNIIIAVACVLALSLFALMFFHRKSQRLNLQLSKRESELLKTNMVKDKLFSIIGHDLRGPIGNAPQMIEIYRQATTTEEEKKYLLDSLMENATASFDTLDKLLYWGQSQIKGVGTKRSVFNPGENVQQVMRLMKGIADQKKISIVNNLPADARVYADPTHFDFVVRNLVSNAIKFTHPGGSIKIKADKYQKPGYLVFSVADTGIGMDREQLNGVFEPFVNSTLGTDNERGTSIGLMLCKEFVEENGGTIWVESEEGKGSTFNFSLLASA